MKQQLGAAILAKIMVAGCLFAVNAVQADDGFAPLPERLQGAAAPLESAPGASLGAAQDCSDVAVNYEDDPTLTPAEKAELMDRALFESLNHFDACQSAAQGGGGGSAGAGAGAGDGAAGVGEGENSGGEGSASGGGRGSVASTGMSGTEKTSAADAESESVLDTGQAGSDQTGQGTDTLEPGDFQSVKGEAPAQNGQRAGGKNLNNGKIPEDIPSADNDSVLEGQIRQAAINETDPKIKAQLWNEYRKYKGLPAVK